MSLSDLRRIFPSQIRPPRRSACLRRPSSSSRSAQPVAAAVRSLIHPVVPSPSQPRFIVPGRRSSDIGLDPSSSFSVLRPPATPFVVAISLVRVSRGRPPPSVAAPADGIGAAEVLLTFQLLQITVVRVFPVILPPTIAEDVTRRLSTSICNCSVLSAATRDALFACLFFLQRHLAS